MRQKPENVMTHLVGTTSRIQSVVFPESTKQAAMLFEQIVIPGLLDMLTKSHQLGVFQQAAEELGWLWGKGIVFEASVEPLNTPRAMTEQDHKLLGEFRNLTKALETVPEEDTESQLGLNAAIEVLSARVTAISLRRHSGLDAVPYFRLSPPPLPSGIETTKANVITIVLNALPIPDGSVPWEHIIEYRSDPDSFSRFLELRNWINEISHSHLSSVEIEQKLEYLLDRYQKHLRLHRLKTQTGTIEGFVVAGMEFLEDLANKKFSKLARGLFRANRSEIELLEAELSFPGKELAYIVKAREAFNSR